MVFAFYPAKAAEPGRPQYNLTCDHVRSAVASYSEAAIAAIIKQMTAEEKAKALACFGRGTRRELKRKFG